MNQGIHRELLPDEDDLWIFDLASSTFEAVTAAGEKRPKVPVELPRLSMISKVVLDRERWWVSTVTRPGHIVMWSGYNASKPETSPARPTVYLDQNMVSRLAKAIHAPERITDPDELSAARRIISLATDDGIIIPLSSGHLLETARLHSTQRYEVGLTLARASWGVQLRHPLDVVQHEATCLIAEHFGLEQRTSVERPVVTTEPDALKFRAHDIGFGTPPPPTLESLKRMILSAAELVQVLVDPEPIERTFNPTWMASQDTASRQIADSGGSKETRRKTARRRFWNDNIGWFRNPAIQHLGQYDFPTFSDSQLKALLRTRPMLHLLSEVFIKRFLTPSSPSRQNDLVDIFYLTCASAYTDYQAGERRTITDINEIRRSNGIAETGFTSLKDLVARLAADGVLTAQEREGAKKTPGPLPD